MQEMDRRVAFLRLLLNDLAERERQALENGEQLRIQMSRIVDVSVRQNVPVTRALSLLAEVEERLAQQEMVLRHLGMLRERAQGELDALLVTRSVSDARLRLAELQRRRAELLGTQATDSTEALDLKASPEEPTTPQAVPAQDQASELADIDAEIHELQAAIEQASTAAARALTADKGEPGQRTQRHPNDEP